MDKLMAVNESDLDVFTSKKMCSLCEFVILIGWYVGCGESCYIDDIKKMSKHFGMMYQLAQDFINIESDLQNADKYTTNYVINIGTQHSYDKFMTHKQKFIQASLTLDTYSNTSLGKGLLVKGRFLILPISCDNGMACPTREDLNLH